MCFTCLHLWSNQQNSQRTFRINSALNKVGYWNLWDDEIMLTESWVGLWRWRYRYSDAAKTHPPAQPKKYAKRCSISWFTKPKLQKKLCALFGGRDPNAKILYLKLSTNFGHPAHNLQGGLSFGNCRNCRKSQKIAENYGNYGNWDSRLQRLCMAFSGTSWMANLPLLCDLPISRPQYKAPIQSPLGDALTTTTDNRY